MRSVDLPIFEAGWVHVIEVAVLKTLIDCCYDAIESNAE